MGDRKGLSDQFDVPILLILFNRPDVTKQTFNAVREIRPKKLYIAADGHREHKLGEENLCKEVRAIVNEVDWPCDVQTLFSDRNLGCKLGEYTAIDWFFENEEEGIILEDDCCPDKTFFYYCEELLKIYRFDNRITMISGRNSLEEWKSSSQSYHFTKFGSVWGWAGWRRAWKYYDVDMKDWAKQEYKDAVRYFVGDQYYNSRKKNYEKTFKGEIDTWDFQWSFAQSCQSGLTVVPSVNLISNVGFGSDATHTNNPNDVMSKVKSKALDLPLKVNDIVVSDVDFDNRLMSMSKKNIVMKILSYLKIYK